MYLNPELEKIFGVVDPDALDILHRYDEAEEVHDYIDVLIQSLYFDRLKEMMEPDADLSVFLKHYPAYVVDGLDTVEGLQPEERARLRAVFDYIVERGGGWERMCDVFGISFDLDNDSVPNMIATRILD